MEQIILVAHSLVLIVITWGIDVEDSKRAYTKYYWKSAVENHDDAEITEWKSIPSYARSRVSSMVDEFCAEKKLVNWSC